MLTMYSDQGVADDDEEEQIHENTTSIVHLAIFPWFVLHNNTTTTAANGDHGPTNYGNAGPCPFVCSIVFCCCFSILRLDNSFCSLLSRFGGHHPFHLHRCRRRRLGAIILILPPSPSPSPCPTHQLAIMSAGGCCLIISLEINPHRVSWSFRN